jgi:uncharacterized protein YjbI with pentapeptide repeats
MERWFAASVVVTVLVGSSALAFDPADLKKLMEPSECASCDLTSAKLKGANLSNAGLRGAKPADRIEAD